MTRGLVQEVLGSGNIRVIDAQLRQLQPHQTHVHRRNASADHASPHAAKQLRGTAVSIAQGTAQRRAASAS